MWTDGTPGRIPSIWVTACYQGLLTQTRGERLTQCEQYDGEGTHQDARRHIPIRSVSILDNGSDE